MFRASFTAILLTATLLGSGAGAQGRRSKPVRSAPVTSSAPATGGKVEFLRDIAPILDKKGCSVAGCHGKFGGRGGFQVSLLTLSPEDDYEPLIFGARGRRVSFAVPEQSLLLLKATGAVPHAGGTRFTVGSPEYSTILRWLKAGAPFSDKDPRLVSLTISPSKIQLSKVGQVQPLRVMATYNDGSKRDVTKQTSFSSTNEAVLAVSPDGVVKGQRWGGGAVMGRYLGTIAASFVTLPQARQGTYPTVAANNVIDKLVFDNLHRLNVIPSPLSTDYEFLRRVSLDTLGRLPTPEEIDAFAKDTGKDKRNKMVDSLLEKPEFTDLRALRLADLLRINPRKFNNNGNLSDRCAALFYEWIWNAVAENKPWDVFVRDVITARGSIYQNGPANFYLVERSPNDRMENVGQAFLGVRMSCARCHKHPFDRWTTDNYWNFAAFMGKVRNEGGRLEREEVIRYDHGAQIRNESVNGKNRGKIAPATFLGDKAPVSEAPDQIQHLADWMTSPQNPFFARATVNRLWSHYFGRGIINPVDDMRATSPETVPGLLDALASELVRSKYDTKQVIRLILNSRTYQLSATPNASNRQDDRFFSHFFPKPMLPQVLLDILNQATGDRETFGSFPERTRAIQAELPIGSGFLDAFGQSHREFLADIDPKLEPNLVQTLMMINSPYIDNKVKNSRFVNSVYDEAKNDDGALVKGLYLRTFCRPPTPAETAKASALIKGAKDRFEAAHDLYWALITAREFYFNH